MKSIIFFVSVLLMFVSCSRNAEIEQLKSQLDSLKQNVYKPGFGEFMSNIQVHHAKLWFAGENQNWDLANFEVHEIKETLDDLQHYQKDRKEAQMVIMIEPPLDSVEISIQQKNPALFVTSFTSLTNTCNNCHKQVNYGFNNVKIPDSPPFSNQVFKTEGQKH